MSRSIVGPPLPSKVKLRQGPAPNRLWALA